MTEEVFLGQPVRGVVAAGQYKYYTVNIAARLDITFDLTQFAGDPDLLINCNSSSLPSFGNSMVRIAHVCMYVDLVCMFACVYKCACVTDVWMIMYVSVHECTDEK